jgi:hypothetical protein
MKKLGTFNEFINEENESQDLNESFLIAAGIAILISLGIRGLRKITKNIALTQDIKPAEFKKLVDEMVNSAKEDSSNNDKPMMDKWGKEMMNRYESGEIKNLEDLTKYLDSSRSIFID